MAKRRTLIGEASRINHLRNNFHLCSQVQIYKALNHVYRGLIISDYAKECIIKAIPTKFIPETKKQIDEHNSILLRKPQPYRPFQNHIEESKPAKFVKYKIGQIIKCKMSDFKVITGHIYYDDLLLKTVRIEGNYDLNIMAAVNETFTIKVEQNNRFHFEPFNQLSKFISSYNDEKLKLERKDLMEKGYPIFISTIQNAKEEISEDISDFQSIKIKDLINYIEYYDNDLPRIFKPEINNSAIYSLCKFFKDVSKVNMIELQFSYFLSKAKNICVKYHIPFKKIKTFESYLCLQVEKVLDIVMSKRKELFEYLFEEAKNRIHKYFEKKYVIQFNSNDCRLEENRIVVNLLNLSIVDDDSIEPLGARMTAFANLMDYEAGGYLLSLQEIIDSEYKKIYNILISENKLILNLNISSNNLSILFPKDCILRVSFSCQPYITTPFVKTEEFYTYLTEELNSFIKAESFLKYGNFQCIPLALLFQTIVNRPQLLVGELLKFSEETHNSWVKFLEKYYKLDTWAILKYPCYYFVPAFQLEGKYFESLTLERFKYLANSTNTIYLISEDYSHISDVDSWSGKPNHVTYLEMSDYFIRIIPTDPVSTQRSFFYPKKSADLALYGIIRYFSSSIPNKRQNWTDFEKIFQEFLTNN